MWIEIAHDYREIKAVLNPFWVPSAAQWDLHVLCVLTHRQMESPLTARSVVYEPIYSVDASRRSALRAVSYELAFSHDLPENWPTFAERPPPINYDLIAQGICDRQSTPAFIHEWGRLKELYGRYIELVHHSERVLAEGGQSISGAAEGHRIQRYWYAHWIRQRLSTLKARDRSPAERELARVCFRIANGSLRPARPYNRQWYGRLLDERAGIAAEQIKGSYRNLSVKKLRELLSDARISERHLPPLRVEAFRLR
ncbi:hypothetical protein YH63_007150 [Afipia massiliensis]|uniref:Uncharacterized protein n=1 Tax=Afipia massiliensis TaxID=211460 RepID=A0A4U6BMV7_9BRAD|nr:hypothetical protein [Afipia massiliensis]TKT71201.1 hypothetical protein YH63_007150 [Afipia massiliensis]